MREADPKATRIPARHDPEDIGVNVGGAQFDSDSSAFRNLPWSFEIASAEADVSHLGKNGCAIAFAHYDRGAQGKARMYRSGFSAHIV